MSRTLIERLNAARGASVPIVAINTPDQPAMASLICRGLATPGAKDTAVICWDFVRGIYAGNKAGITAMASLPGGGDELGKEHPFAPLAIALANMPKGTVLLYLNAQRFVGDAAVMQALMNLRDHFKGDGRMVILVGNAITLPPELSTDVIVFSEELPDDERLIEIVTQQIVDSADQFTKRPEKDDVRKAAVALRGTSAFGAEQLTCMSFSKNGIDRDVLHTQAKTVIEQTQGLMFERGRETFDDVRGLGFAKEYGGRLFAGPEAPACIIRVEELEKAMRGSKGDLSGTSGDALQVMLTEMEDNGWGGMMAYGTPGAGKSLYAKTLANTYGAKALRFDINACKGSLVGQSEKQIRQAMSVIRAIGGDRVFFVASCNGLDTIEASLQRRFTSGVWFFDLPSDEDRAAMWELYRAKFKIKDSDETPDEPDLTGADVRNICRQAYVLRCSLAEARRYVVPLKVQSPHEIDAARKLARGRFTCASKGGVYGVQTEAEPKAGRKVRVA